jgi:hypothetical protein
MGGNPPPRMTPAQLVALAESVYGPRWRRPLARAIGRSPRLIRHLESGDRSITAQVEGEIVAALHLGPVGQIVRGSVRKAWPSCDPLKAHSISRQAESDLLGSGLVRQIESPGRR